MWHLAHMRVKYSALRDWSKCLFSCSAVQFWNLWNKCKIQLTIFSLYVQEFIELPPSQFSSNGSVSLLQFHLHSARDYGTVQCRASNTLGTQLQPCTVTLVRRGEASQDITWIVALWDFNANGMGWREWSSGSGWVDFKSKYLSHIYPVCARQSLYPAATPAVTGD